ncbi:hypothetical protein ABLN87_09885 [Ruegeria sp. SCPT10]
MNWASWGMWSPDEGTMVVFNWANLLFSRIATIEEGIVAPMRMAR